MQNFLKSGSSSLDHAVCDVIIPGGFVRVIFFDFIPKFLWFDVLVKERVSRKGGVLYFVQCLFFTSCYPMGSCLILGGLCMLQEMMSLGIPEPVPSLRIESDWA